MIRSFKTKYSYRDIAQVSENLGKLNKSGIKLTRTFELLMDLPLRKDYIGSIKKVKKDVVKGKGLYESFNKYNNIYPSLFLNLLKTGEDCGDVYKVMMECARYYYNMESLKKKISSAVAYPIFLTGLLILVFLGFIFFILPTFQSLFTSSGKGLSAILKFFLSINDIVRKKPVIAMVYIICWGGGIAYMLKKLLKGRGRLLYSKTALGRSFLEYECLLNLNIILSSGVGIQKGVISFNKNGGNKAMNGVMSEITTYILKGYSLTHSMKLTSIFSKYTLSILAIGEESGNLEEKIERLCEDLQKDLDGKLEKLSSKIGPIFLVIISILVGIFAVNIFGPFMDILGGGINR